MSADPRGAERFCSSWAGLGGARVRAARTAVSAYFKAPVSCLSPTGPSTEVEGTAPATDCRGRPPPSGTTRALTRRLADLTPPVVPDLNRQQPGFQPGALSIELTTMVTSPRPSLESVRGTRRANRATRHRAPPRHRPGRSRCLHETLHQRRAAKAAQYAGSSTNGRIRTPSAWVGAKLLSHEHARVMIPLRFQIHSGNELAEGQCAHHAASLQPGGLCTGSG